MEANEKRPVKDEPAPPQNDQLMSENRILCLKSALQFEWRGHESKE